MSLNNNAAQSHKIKSIINNGLPRKMCTDNKYIDLKNTGHKKFYFITLQT